ncbi:hypothetical protein DFH09DRAFT_1179387, partial [Mycena vulgaris]
MAEGRDAPEYDVRTGHDGIVQPVRAELRRNHGRNVCGDAFWRMSARTKCQAQGTKSPAHSSRGPRRHGGGAQSRRTTASHVTSGSAYFVSSHRALALNISWGWGRDSAPRPLAAIALPIDADQGLKSSRRGHPALVLGTGPEDLTKNDENSHQPRLLAS